MSVRRRRRERVEVVMSVESEENLPVFSDDLAADQWLRSQSPFYNSMAIDVEQRGGCIFRDWDEPLGIVVHENGTRYIQLNNGLKGASRLSILIFEMTNAFQDAKHFEVDRRTRIGAIDHAEIFAVRHELIEYDGLRYHRIVLAELENSMGSIPREMLTWINPNLTTLASYSLPLAHEYLESQDRNGHTDHYRRYFPRMAGSGEKT
jgi:hypothetical protein